VAPNLPISTTEGATINFHWEEGDSVGLFWMGIQDTAYFHLVPGSISQDGKTASFVGEPLGEMSNYSVLYRGLNFNKPYRGAGYTTVTVTPNKLQPTIWAWSGNEDGFTLNTFDPMVSLPLTGDAKISHILFADSVSGESGYVNFYDLTFAEPVQLSATATYIYFGWSCSYNCTGLKFSFYDEENTCIKVLESKKNWWADIFKPADYGTNQLFAFPSVEVNAAPATKGKAKRKLAGGGEVDVEWVQLWSGGPKWATYNLGANSATEYGDYFCWGGSYANGEGKAFEDDHNTGSADIQYGNDDTAKKKWGENWQMPKKTDFDNLLANTTSEWIENYQSSGKNGYLFTGKGVYAENSIFLPATGYCASGNIYGAGNMSTYWSSTPDGSFAAWSLFTSSSMCQLRTNNRNDAYPVRAILRESIKGQLDTITKENGEW